MSLLFDLAKTYAIGLLLFVAIPMATAPLSWERKRGVIHTFTGMAMSALGRGLLIQREHGGLLLKKTKFDTRLGAGAELARMGGELKHWKDPENLMSTLHGKPFGLAHEAKNAIVDARMCRAGRLLRELDEAGERELEADGTTFYTAFFHISDDHPLVSITDALPLIQGSGDPGLPDRIETYVEKGNQGYDTTQIKQGAEWLTMMAVGFGLTWIGSKLAAAGGGTISTLAG